jgi:hypothetical protein
LGDFPTSNRTGESLSLAAQDIKLAFPSATLALEASASADSSDQLFIGYGERAQGQEPRLDFVLWPRGSSCELFRGGYYPDELGGQAIGYATKSGVVLVAGSNQGMSATVVGALTFDGRTGESNVLDPRRGLAEPRAFATVSDFGTQILVAGGENPIHEPSEAANVLRDSAEVYDPSSHTFEQELVKLAVPITHHAAITLLSGETALVGGRDAGSLASNYIQLVSPETRRGQLADSLTVGRSSPTVLRLSDGRLLVAGGDDASGKPVPTLEWRDADAGRLGAPFDGGVSLPARYDRAFAAVAGGSLLAVGGCADRPPTLGEDCTAWCQRGCPPLPDAKTSELYDAFWISAQGEVTRLAFPISAGRPVLLPGSDGRPWLLANDLDPAGQARPGSRALYHFDPWQTRFDRVPSSVDQETARAGTRFIATGTDAFVWLDPEDAGPVLAGMRLATRSAFSSDVELVTLRDSEDPSRPAHLVPDRPPGSDVQYNGGALSFAAAPSAIDTTCVWVSDAEYGDFSASVDFSTAVAPTLRLGPQAFADPGSAVAHGACPLPSRDAAALGGTVQLQRSGSHVSLTLGSMRSDCDTSSLRLPFGVCGSELGPTSLTRISVVRGS